MFLILPSLEKCFPSTVLFVLISLPSVFPTHYIIDKKGLVVKLMQGARDLSSLDESIARALLSQ